MLFRSGFDAEIEFGADVDAHAVAGDHGILPGAHDPHRQHVHVDRRVIVNEGQHEGAAVDHDPLAEAYARAYAEVKRIAAMPKPDPSLLDPARYPFRCLIETRFRDLDSNMHVNNGVFASLLEEGRVRFHRASQFGGVSGDLTSMVVSAAIEYLGENVSA